MQRVPRSSVHERALLTSTACPALSGYRWQVRSSVVEGVDVAARWRGMLPAAVPLFLLSACDDDAPSLLEPRGPGAERVADLWWLMLWIATGVFLVVVGMLAAAIFRGLYGKEATRGDVSWGEPFIVIAGVVVPALILSFLFVLSLRDMRALSAPESESDLTVEVVGHDWWWEVRYPNGTVTANEMHIPVGQPVLFKVRTGDVIHSFWIPQLQVKVDMLPEKVNELWVEADEPGRYRGQCAEYCGLQHANMIFYVIAEPRERFDEWLASETRPRETPAIGSARVGETVFLNGSCAGCHTIRGTDATGDVGPDLTHIGTRETIAAGVLDNTRSDMELWLRDPQHVKPGATMPPTELSPSELQAVLDYLQGLK